MNNPFEKPGHNDPLNERLEKIRESNDVSSELAEYKKQVDKASEEYLETIREFLTLRFAILAAKNMDQLADVVLASPQLSSVIKNEQLNIFSGDEAKFAFIQGRLLEIISLQLEDHEEYLETMIAYSDEQIITLRAKLQQLNDELKRGSVN